MASKPYDYPQEIVEREKGFALSCTESAPPAESSRPSEADAVQERQKP
jgi:hypothetical protein